VANRQSSNSNLKTAQYLYDARNRRVQVQTAGATTDYRYDFAGHRISSWLNPTAANPLGTGVEGRLYWGGQQIAFRAGDGTTYFEHQDWTGTERWRTNYAGAYAAWYSSLPWGESASSSVGDGNQDDALFAGLDLDTESGTGHAQFRNYSETQGRWLAPDPYDGSYDITNPQSFNRYLYAQNNPIVFTDPSGQFICLICAAPEAASCGPVCVGILGGITAGILIAEGLEDLFKPKFHGTLAPRPGSGTPDWGDDPGSFGESLGIGSNVKTGSWGIAPALGLPDAGCEFGACGGGVGSFQQGAAQPQQTQTPPPLTWLDRIFSAWPLNGNLVPYHGQQDQKCTTGPFEPGMDSNPAILSCCQAHDNCYKQFNCNMTSWSAGGNPFGICKACNAAVVSCIGSAVKK
jgi:RHS repeat-associated protein